MNVILIQPPEPPQPVRFVEDFDNTSLRFFPPWNLLCLRSYILEHTRHSCYFVDARLQADLEKDFVGAIARIPDPKVAVINTCSSGLGQTAAVLDSLKRHFPSIVTVLCGQHPSQYPGHCTDIPRVDYALAGDPEPILRNLLDYMGIEQRLRRVPGLCIADRKAPYVDEQSGSMIFESNRNVRPYWLHELTSLSLPDWQGVFWPSYPLNLQTGACRAEVRISRGQSREPCDRAHGGLHEPLRFWPLERIAASLAKGAHLGVTEVFLTDPPGVWTTDRLDHWCMLLEEANNTQPWGLQMLPTLLHENTVDLMKATECRRIEFIFPSCDPDLLRRYGCILPIPELAKMIGHLHNHGINVHTRYWIGGPEEQPGEAERVAQTIRQLHYGHFSLQPFPLLMDSPLYAEYAETSATPHLQDWLQWTIAPWTVEQPVALWGGRESVIRITEEFEAIKEAVHKSPKRVLKQAMADLRSTNWILALEDWLSGLLRRFG